MNNISTHESNSNGSGISDINIGIESPLDGTLNIGAGSSLLRRESHIHDAEFGDDDSPTNVLLNEYTGPV